MSKQPVFRVGRSLGRTVYRQAGYEASKEDFFLGIFDSKVHAQFVCDVLNQAAKDDPESVRRVFLTVWDE